MMLSDEQLTDLRQFVALARDGRCVAVDADGARCMRRPNEHRGPCDWPYTRWLDTATGADALARAVLARSAS